MTVHNYMTKGGKDLIMSYIESLSKTEMIDGLSVLKKFENDEIDQLYTKRWEGNIREVYFYKHNRLFYVVIKGKDVYILHACGKQKNKTESNDREIIIRRAKELKNILRES